MKKSKKKNNKHPNIKIKRSKMLRSRGGTKAIQLHRQKKSSLSDSEQAAILGRNLNISGNKLTKLPESFGSLIVGETLSLSSNQLNSIYSLSEQAKKDAKREPNNHGINPKNVGKNKRKTNLITITDRKEPQPASRVPKGTKLSQVINAVMGIVENEEKLKEIEDLKVQFVDGVIDRIQLQQGIRSVVGDPTLHQAIASIKQFDPSTTLHPLQARKHGWGHFKGIYR